ncbi:hypothetical protein CHELA40_13933 [Chelatococcus asaccharovorans]|nr:hypothetical protein CHELA40_13933 [Chelatococcus asaccharovorans]CAH1674626.1 hypothetical protein CHELA17_61695 [Chelatococcus asaccharovorans]
MPDEAGPALHLEGLDDLHNADAGKDDAEHQARRDRRNDRQHDGEDPTGNQQQAEAQEPDPFRADSFAEVARLNTFSVSACHVWNPLSCVDGEIFGKLARGYIFINQINISRGQTRAGFVPHSLNTSYGKGFAREIRCGQDVSTVSS